MKPWTQYENQILQTSMCPPAVRTLIVEVVQYESGEVEYIQKPVIALELRVSESWCKKVMEGNIEILPPRGQEDDCGWRFTGIEHEVLPIIVDEGYLSEGCDDCTNSVSEIVACPWPESEDDSKLEPIRKSLLESLKDKIQRQKDKALSKQTSPTLDKSHC